MTINEVTKITNVVTAFSYLIYTFESSCDIFASVSRSEAANNSLNGQSTNFISITHIVKNTTNVCVVGSTGADATVYSSDFVFNIRTD